MSGEMGFPTVDGRYEIVDEMLTWQFETQGRRWGHGISGIFFEPYPGRFFQGKRFRLGCSTTGATWREFAGVGERFNETGQQCLGREKVEF